MKVHNYSNCSYRNVNSHREYFLRQLLLPIYHLPGHSGPHFRAALSALPRWLDTIELKNYVARAKRLSLLDQCVATATHNIMTGACHNYKGFCLEGGGVCFPGPPKKMDNYIGKASSSIIHMDILRLLYTPLWPAHVNPVKVS